MAHASERAVSCGNWWKHLGFGCWWKVALLSLARASMTLPRNCLHQPPNKINEKLRLEKQLPLSFEITMRQHCTAVLEEYIITIIHYTYVCHPGEGKKKCYPAPF